VRALECPSDAFKIMTSMVTCHEPSEMLDFEFGSFNLITSCLG
jgi:hypothetical protein